MTLKSSRPGTRDEEKMQDKMRLFLEICDDDLRSDEEIHGDSLLGYHKQSRYRDAAEYLLKTSVEASEKDLTDFISFAVSKWPDTFAKLYEYGVSRRTEGGRWPPLLRGLARNPKDANPKTEEEATAGLHRILKEREDFLTKRRPTAAAFILMTVASYVETVYALGLSHRRLEPAVFTFFNFSGKGWCPGAAREKAPSDEEALNRRLDLIAMLLDALRATKSDPDLPQTKCIDRNTRSYLRLLAADAVLWFANDALDIATSMGEGLSEANGTKMIRLVVEAFAFLVNDVWYVNALSSEYEKYDRATNFLRRLVDYPLTESPFCTYAETIRKPIKAISFGLGPKEGAVISSLAMAVSAIVALGSDTFCHLWRTESERPELPRGSAADWIPARDLVVAAALASLTWLTWRKNIPSSHLEPPLPLRWLSSRRGPVSVLIALSFAANEFPEKHRDAIARLVDEELGEELAGIRRTVFPGFYQRARESDVPDGFACGSRRERTMGFTGKKFDNAVTSMLFRIAREKNLSPRLLEKVVLPFVLVVLDHAIERRDAQFGACALSLLHDVLAIVWPEGCESTRCYGASRQAAVVSRFWNEALRSGAVKVKSLRKMMSRASETSAICCYFANVPGIDPMYPVLEVQDSYDLSRVAFARWREYWEVTKLAKPVAFDYDEIELWYRDKADAKTFAAREGETLMDAYVRVAAGDLEEDRDLTRRVYETMRRLRKKRSRWTTMHEMMSALPAFRIHGRDATHIVYAHEFPFGEAVFSGSVLVRGAFYPFEEVVDQGPVVEAESARNIVGSEKKASIFEVALPTMVVQRALCRVACPITRRQHDFLFLEVAARAFAAWGDRTTADRADSAESWLKVEPVVRAAMTARRKLDAKENAVFLVPSELFDDSDASFWSLIDEAFERVRGSAETKSASYRHAPFYYSFLSLISPEALRARDDRDAALMKKFFDATAPRYPGCLQTLYEGILVPMKETLCDETGPRYPTRRALWEMLEETTKRAIDQYSATETPLELDDFTRDLSKCVEALVEEEVDEEEAAPDFLVGFCATLAGYMKEGKVAWSYRILGALETAAASEALRRGTRIIHENLLEDWAWTKVPRDTICFICVHNVARDQTVYQFPCGHLTHLGCAVGLARRFYERRKACYYLGLQNSEVWEYIEDQTYVPFIEVKTAVDEALNANSCPMCRAQNALVQCDRHVASKDRLPRDFHLDSRRVYLARIRGERSSSSSEDSSCHKKAKNQ